MWVVKGYYSSEIDPIDRHLIRHISYQSQLIPTSAREFKHIGPKKTSTKVLFRSNIRPAIVYRRWMKLPLSLIAYRCHIDSRKLILISCWNNIIEHFPGANFIAGATSRWGGGNLRCLLAGNYRIPIIHSFVRVPSLHTRHSLSFRETGNLTWLGRKLLEM